MQCNQRTLASRNHSLSSPHIPIRRDIETHLVRRELIQLGPRGRRPSGGVLVRVGRGVADGWA